MAFEWLPDVLVPVGLGLVSAFGATKYTNRLAVQRDRQARDDEAEEAIRAYANSLWNYALFLEEKAIAGAFWDPKKAVMEPGSVDKIRAAWVAAQPYFHRLQITEKEREAVANRMPDHGDDAMEGSDSFAKRAKLVFEVLGRGLQPRPERRKK